MQVLEALNTDYYRNGERHSILNNNVLWFKKNTFAEFVQNDCQLTTIDDSAKGGLTQFWEIITVIPYAPKYLKRQ